MAFPQKTHRRVSILGIHFSFVPRHKVYEGISNMAQQGLPGYVCVSNVHTTMTAYWDHAYREVQNKSTFTVPDGVPLVWAMNLLRPRNMSPQDRVRGPTMMRELCKQTGFRHYLFGGTPEALRTLEEYLHKEYPGIVIAGSESPPFRPSWTEPELEYDPEDYPQLLKPLVRGYADVVFGSRFIGLERRVLYYHHSLINKFLTFTSNVFTNLNLTDMETCYKVFKKEILAQITLKSDRFGFEPEVTAKVAKIKCRIFEVGIRYHGRTYEEGKKITWKDGVAALWHIIRFNLFSSAK